MSALPRSADQPDGFAFTEANLAWAETCIGRYPEGRQASAILPLLWRAQEQEGWLSVAAMECVGGMLGMASIRVLEVASFYSMFHLAPVGRRAHLQVCGTTPCMLCGSDALLEICRRELGPEPKTLYGEGDFSWEEVECLGACANAPVIQIGKDFYEDLTPEALREILAVFRRGERPRPGSAIGRFASEPAGGGCVLQDLPRESAENASRQLFAEEFGEGRE